MGVVHDRRGGGSQPEIHRKRQRHPWLASGQIGYWVIWGAWQIDRPLISIGRTRPAAQRISASPGEISSSGSRSRARTGVRAGSTRSVEDLPPRMDGVEWVRIVVFSDGTNLGVSRIGVEYVTEELACYGYACDNQPVDVVRVDHKWFAGYLGGQFGHSIKINEEREEDLVGGRTIFVDAEEVCFERNCRDVSSMER